MSQLGHGYLIRNRYRVVEEELGAERANCAYWTFVRSSTGGIARPSLSPERQPEVPHEKCPGRRHLGVRASGWCCPLRSGPAFRRRYWCCNAVSPLGSQADIKGRLITPAHQKRESPGAVGRLKLRTGVFRVGSWKDRKTRNPPFKNTAIRNLPGDWSGQAAPRKINVACCSLGQAIPSRSGSCRRSPL